MIILSKIQPKKSKKREELNSNHFQYRNTEVVEIENLLQKKDYFLVELVSVEEKAILNEIKLERADYVSVGLRDLISKLFLDKGINDKNFTVKYRTLKNEFKIRGIRYLRKIYL